MIVGMSIDFAECDRARLARDAAYDGLFYTGVHTTGIYCRPVCPVRPAAAEVAGFRPCLRCRPETAPFCGAWIGSRATVERGLRLIVEEGALDQEGGTVESLAERLGVGSRQTALPMTEIAMRAGFGSLRRFNSVFAEVYGRPPTKIRRRLAGTVE